MICDCIKALGRETPEAGYDDNGVYERIRGDYGDYLTYINLFCWKCGYVFWWNGIYRDDYERRDENWDRVDLFDLLNNGVKGKS